MGTQGYVIDFDGDPLKLVRTAYHQARTHQIPRHDQWKRDYKLFNGIIDMTLRDPDRANIFIPKIWEIIRTKLPKDVKPLTSTRPYIPLTTQRKEFQPILSVWEDIMDHLLELAGWIPKLVLLRLLKLVYGTSFIDATPYYEQDTEPVLMQTPYGPQFKRKTVHRVRLRMRVWAPWEVFVDPYATNLEEEDGCRYVIKMQLTSKRAIARLAMQGGYPDLDLEKFKEAKQHHMTTGGDHWGYEILSGIGLTQPYWDPDIGIILRYESPDRYVDLWNGEVVLRDVDKTNSKEGINLSRDIHDMDAHTQNQLWGVSEVKPNEVLQEMYNDLHNQAFDSWNLMGQPVVYYDNKAGISPAQLIRSMGNKIAVNRHDDRPISDYILESFGRDLPATHFQMVRMIEDRMDQTSRQFPVSRGETAEGDVTATEIVKADEKSDLSHELGVKIAEYVTLGSFGRKLIGMLEKAVRMDDMIEIVGQQRAVIALLSTPSDLPGKYNFGFKGADRVANMIIKQRNWKELAGILIKIPNVLQGALATKLLEVFEEDDEDTKNMIIPDEIMMQLMAMKAKQDQINGQAPGGGGGRNYKQVTGKGEAQRDAQEARRGAA